MILLSTASAMSCGRVMLNCCVVLISALLMGKVTRNRIKSYWNAAALVVEQASRISETQESCKADSKGLSVLRLAGGAVHGSEYPGAAEARRSSANARAACARLLHSIRQRERDRHRSQRCGYPFGAADPASRLLPAHSPQEH